MFDLKEVKKLVRLLEQSQISEIEISDKDRKIRLTKSTQGDGQFGQTIVTAPTVVPPPVPADVQVPAAPQTVGANVKLVKSPMVGTYYAAPSPDSEPYVQVGDQVHKGQVLCIIEAMKLMNELESDFDGRIVEMHVENAQPVEFDNLLFTIETA